MKGGATSYEKYEKYTNDKNTQGGGVPARLIRQIAENP